jgi:hypothetical protein
MLVHSVYFWLKADCTPEQHSAFLQGLESLRDIPDVDSLYIGTPASTNRPVIDRSYSYALTVVLADMERHDAYQDHAIHDAFRDLIAPMAEKVVIYDAI